MNQIPITKKAWRELKEGDGLKDVYDAIWKVTGHDKNDPDTIHVIYPGLTQEDSLTWENGKIIDNSDYSSVPELNDDSACIIKKD